MGGARARGTRGSRRSRCALVAALAISALPAVLAVSPGVSEAAPAAGGQGKPEFERALRYSKAGEWEAALPWFKKAYELSGKRPSTIIALAQCERELKQYGEAIGHFREYLAGTPRPKDAKTIEETIALLEDLQREQAAARREREAAASNGAERGGKTAGASSAAAAGDTTRASTTRDGALKPGGARISGTAGDATDEAKASKGEVEAAHASPADKTKAATGTGSGTGSGANGTSRSGATNTAGGAGLGEPGEARDLGIGTKAPEPPAGGVLSSPLFWVVTGAVVLGGGIALGLALSAHESDPYAGSTGVLLRKLEAE